MEETYFLLKKMYRLSHIPIRYLDPKQEEFTLCFGCNSNTDPVACDANLLSRLLCHTPDNLPLIDSETQENIYASFFDKHDLCIILGPVSSTSLPTSFGDVLSMLYFSFTGKIIQDDQLILFQTKFDDIKLQNELPHLQFYQMNNVEQEKNRYSRNEEELLMKLIENGDVESLRPMISVVDINLVNERVGKLADTTLKNMEYLICTSIALAARAAMSEGLDANVSYAMADVFMQKLSHCTTVKSILQLHKEVIFSYATRVKKTKDERSKFSYIETCKVYIENHLNKPFTLEDISHELGINKSYLSRRFSELEGVSLMKYTQNKRIQAAKNMLKYSGVTIPNIATYLCFNSQSHFGAIFKNHTGMTPSQYRHKEYLIDYHVDI